MSQSPAVANWFSGLSGGSTLNSTINFNCTPPTCNCLYRKCPQLSLILLFVFHSAICVIPTVGSTWISGSLPTPDHYHLIIKDFFTDWYVVSNTGKLPVNGGLNGHTLCLHRPLRLHCPLTCPFQSTWGFKSRFFSSSPVFSSLGPIVHVQEKALRFLIEQGPPCVYLLTTWHNRK